MLHYKKGLNANARLLRSNQTDAEQVLWLHLRRKQIKKIQFYRQRPIGRYIVDFYAPSVSLVIEVDGSQHFNKVCKEKDKIRDNYLRGLNLRVLRFNNLEVLTSIDGVLETIFDKVSCFLTNPP